jgi:hypothetical protein
MTMTRRAWRPTRSLLLAAAALSASACSGYGDLPLPVREEAPLVIEAVDLTPGRTGRVQVRAELPASVSGPMHVLASPVTFDPNAAVLGWSAGPCPNLPAPQTPDPARLCLAVVMATGVGADRPFTLNVLFEARAQARRFTVTGEVTP